MLAASASSTTSSPVVLPVFTERPVIGLLLMSGVTLLLRLKTSCSWSWMCPLQLSSRWNSLMTKTKIPVHCTWRGSCGWTVFWKDPPPRKFENPDPGQYHQDQSGQWPWDRRRGDCTGCRATRGCEGGDDWGCGGGVSTAIGERMDGPHWPLS